MKPSPEAIRYRLGSVALKRLSLAAVFASLSISSVLLWIFSEAVGGSEGFSLAAALIFFLTGWGLLFLSDFDSSDTIAWLNDIVDHLSYGWAAEDGIHYRKWLRWRFVAWKQVERVEYWPERGGRVDLHLFPLISPITCRSRAAFGVSTRQSPKRRDPRHRFR